MATDNNWRVIFAIPGIVALVQIVMLLAFFRHEPLAFLISKKRLDEAKVLCKLVYRDISDEQASDIVSGMLANVHEEASEVSFKEAMFDRKYRSGTLVVVMANLFCTLSGIDAIMMYTSRLLQNLDSATMHRFPVSPTLGTSLVGIVLFITALFSTVTLDKFG
jgi:hypothetical protein